MAGKTKSSEHTTPDRAFLIAWDNVSPVNVFLLFIKIHFKKRPKVADDISSALPSDVVRINCRLLVVEYVIGLCLHVTRGRGASQRFHTGFKVQLLVGVSRREVDSDWSAKSHVGVV